MTWYLTAGMVSSGWLSLYHVILGDGVPAMSQGISSSLPISPKVSNCIFLLKVGFSAKKVKILFWCLCNVALFVSISGPVVENSKKWKINNLKSLFLFGQVKLRWLSWVKNELEIQFSSGWWIRSCKKLISRYIPITVCPNKEYVQHWARHTVKLLLLGHPVVCTYQWL